MRGNKSIWYRVMRQHSIGKVIGGIKDVALHTAAWVSMVNFAMIGIVAYNTTLREYILEYMPWMTMFIFMGFLALCVFLAMIIEWKFIIPSTWAFRNAQQYEHQYPIKKDMERLSEKLDRLEKMILEKGKGKKDAD